MVLNYKTTADIEVPKKLVDQVIGQDDAVEIIKKAALQRRHVLLIGEPGTGKSLLGLALAELLPKEKLVDVLAYPNPNDDHQPLIKTVEAGKGRELVAQARIQNLQMFKTQNLVLFVLVIISMIAPWWARNYYQSDIMFAAFFLGGMIFLAAFVLFLNMGQRFAKNGKDGVPQLIVDNFGRKNAPFFDATGAHAGALLGDILHDPFQCIPGDQIVHLENGKPVKICNLVDPILKEEGEMELNEDKFKVLAGDDNNYGYQSAIVNKVFKRKIKEEIIEIVTKRGYKIKVTKNHPLAVYDDSGKISYVSAGALPKNSTLILPEKLPITASKKLPESLVLFIADALAYGHITERSIIFKVRRDFKAQLFISDIRKLGFVPSTIFHNKDIEIYLNSKDFVRKLKASGIKEDDKKSIPAVIFDLNQEQIKLFLIRYLSIDGHVSKQGQFELFSKELIPQFLPLLLKIGIKAKYRERIDTGFGKEKGTIQPRIIFRDYQFAKEYYQKTINPVHKKNLEEYFESVNKTHIQLDDIIPISFNWLELIRQKTGLSKTKVHNEYYSLNQSLKSSKKPTRQFLQKLVGTFFTHTNDPLLFKLRNVVEGTYAYDEIDSIKTVPYEGFVYNLTTSTGTYLVNNILTHNSGGLGTPAHERVVAGMIHKAHMGVLFVDEIATLHPATQQELLTSLQEGKFAITGQSERSAGAMVRTEPVPCNFVLVAAGNIETIKNMHPALRSRIRGYGYEVYMRETIEDSKENRDKIARFVAQEVVKDGKIPHFSKAAVEAIIEEARRRANRKGHLTLRFRELGGLIRAAGDIAKEQNSKLVEPKHIVEAKRPARALEQQIADKYIERKREYEVIRVEGKQVGRVNGLAVIGSGSTYSGIILPIEAEVVPGGKEKEIVATGKLGEIAKEAVKNVSAIIKKFFGEDIKKYDIYVQFLQTYEGVEGDSASIAVATAIISSLKNLPIKQDIAITGSLSVRGEVLPIGGVSSKIEACIDAGLKKVIIPKSNLQDIVIDAKKLEKIKVVPVETIAEALQEAIDWKGKEAILEAIHKA
ncbi:MAG: ATP-dependent protease LonB [Candidatus Woesearchaeota archaeon]